MLTGRVSGELEARITVVFAGAGGGTPIEMVIDTGFNGYITLTPELVSRMSLLEDGFAEAELGDGSVVLLKKYMTFIEWHGGPREVSVLEAAGQPLAGMSLLSGSSLLIDVRPDGRVAVEPLVD